MVRIFSSRSSSPGWVRCPAQARRLLVLLVAGSFLACVRPPVETVCPEVTRGDLVFSEIRGSQSGMDTYGQWIELYNASGKELPLGGLVVVVGKLTEETGTPVAVRSSDLRLAAGDRVVLGRFAEDDRPGHVDYGFLADYDGNLPESGWFDLLACGEVIDEVLYHDLPSEGSLGFDGGLPLTAVANDTEGDWCIDDRPARNDGGGQTDVGVPGSPGEENLPCG